MPRRMTRPRTLPLPFGRAEGRPALQRLGGGGDEGFVSLPGEFPGCPPPLIPLHTPPPRLLLALSLRPEPASALSAPQDAIAAESPGQQSRCLPLKRLSSASFGFRASSFGF